MPTNPLLAVGRRGSPRSDGVSPGGTRVLALIVALIASLVVQIAAVPQNGFAASVADPLPRAYQVDSRAEIADLEFSTALLALSADGNTALHLSPRGDDPAALVATDLGDGESEVVGLDLEGAPFRR